MAREIVSLVERIDGPAPLNRIDQHVSGFRALHGPSWSYFMRHSAGEAVLWDGMTEAGYKALRHVLNEREVALQLVNALPYIFENVRLIDPDWQPVLLLPVRAANINGPHWAFRVPPALAPQMMLRLRVTIAIVPLFLGKSALPLTTSAPGKLGA